MKKTAISYIRFSTAQQAEGESLERQARLARDYASKHDMVLDETLTMRDLGISAFTGKNLAQGALGAFVKAVVDKKVPPSCYLLIEDVDRLSRLPVMDALEVFKTIINGGVTVVTLKDEIQYTAEGLRDDWTRLMPVLVSMGRGYDESVRKSERIRDGWAAKKTKARKDKTPLGALAPAWLEYVPPNEKLRTPAGYVVDESKVEVIELIFKLSIGGKGMVAIAHELRERGIPPFGKRGVGSWSGSSLQRLLKNRALLGEYQPSEYIPYVENGVRKRKQKPVGRPIEGFYPRVLDDATFLKATEALASRKIHNVTRQAKRVNLWQGVIKCTHCGGALHLTTREHKYLICYKARLGQCKDAKFIRLDLAEEYFKQMLAKIDSMALVESSNHELDAKLMDAKVALSKCQSDVDYFMDQYRNPATRSNGLAILLAEAEQSVKSAEAHVKEVESQYAKEAIVDKEEFFRRLDLESDEGRRNANALVKQIKVCAYASGKVFQVRQDGTPLFSLSPHYTGGIHITAHTPEQMQKIMVQDGASLDQVINFNREQRKAAGIPEPTWTPPGPDDQGTHNEQVEEWDWSNTTLDPDEYTAR